MAFFSRWCANTASGRHSVTLRLATLALSTLGAKRSYKHCAVSVCSGVDKVPTGVALAGGTFKLRPDISARHHNGVASSIPGYQKGAPRAPNPEYFTLAIAVLRS